MTVCAASALLWQIRTIFLRRARQWSGTHYRIKVGKGGAWPEDVMLSMSLQPQQRATRKTFAQKRSRRGGGAGGAGRTATRPRARQ